MGAQHAAAVAGSTKGEEELGAGIAAPMGAAAIPGPPHSTVMRPHHIPSRDRQSVSLSSPLSPLSPSRFPKHSSVLPSFHRHWPFPTADLALSRRPSLSHHHLRPLLRQPARFLARTTQCNMRPQVHFQFPRNSLHHLLFPRVRIRLYWRR